jgi:hypothetical protein
MRSPPLERDSAPVFFRRLHPILPLLPNGETHR